MAISFVGATAALAASVALPAHQAGDLILIGTRRTGSATPPSLPGTYNNIQASTVSNTSARVGYLIAASSGETSGTWTNASVITVLILRGASGIGGSSKSETTASTMPAIPAMVVINGTSWVVGFNARTTASGSEPTGFAGMTLRQEGTVATPRAAVLDTNGGVSSWAAAAGDTATQAQVNISVEIIAAVSGQGLRLSHLRNHRIRTP